MCDEQTEKDIDAFQRKGGKLNRRDFAKLSAVAGFSVLLPSVANAVESTESEVKISTPDGVADAYFVHPKEGKHPAVLIWTDILSLRPAFRAMAKRLAESGYAVLVPNPYYRSAKAPVVKLGASFGDPETREIVMPMYRQLNAQTHARDAIALIGFLDQQAAVDTDRSVGTAGYCMGGPMIMRTAAAVPERVGAAASFHGGGLATDKDDSPHLLIPQTKAQVLHAIAQNDDEKDPKAKNVLREAYAAASIPAEIEVYVDTLHGWCPPDSAAYNQEKAERAWARLLALFERALV
ncbi:MAG: carboxymethylenebutenolidase [Cryomorphaceae bacterium]|jgi:carboxymethylenebutenolidase